MLIQYKKDFEKTTMGLLSLLDDFKNIDNLKGEIRLNEDSSEFKLFLCRNNGNIVGLIGTQEENNFIVIRYISLAPGYNTEQHLRLLMQDLKKSQSGKRITTFPEYTYLLKYLKNNEENRKSNF